ncbi:LysM peptidoglycan-binding domain-containing protein [Actinomyces howellii]|uniref:Bacterial transcriptional activator domain-containing protein n=1 Tax=Actinomyces howellii TaxID=52771 RepID=A0A3S4RG85_9ACTO|nr:hypothetical protein [Actinomyces howellii]VEG28990.1 Uncharacterised protein [Actinomyces howellii]
MSLSTPNPAASGPQRFRAPVARTRPPAWRSLLSGAALLAVVVGLPAVLLTTLGPPPVPSDLDPSVLLSSVSPAALLGLLEWVLWLGWLQFTVCTLVEVVSALRGEGMPSHIPLSGGVQGLVRRLVISALLLTSLSAPVATAAPVLHTPAAAAQSVEQAPAAAPQTAADPAGTQAQAPAPGQEGVRYMLGDIELDRDTGAALVGQRVYVVQPPDGRYHDNLWDIAERNLGEGRAYPEIYDLNVGRVQPDGRSLELARLIQPGWLLVMPESATSVDRVVAVPMENPPPPPPTETPGQDGSGVDQQATGAQDVAPAEVPSVGGLLAACLIAVLARQRRQWLGPGPQADAAELERLLRVSADKDRARRLDAALRSLAVMPDKPMPYAVAIDDHACYVRLASPRHDAPAPWHSQEEGLTWTLRAGQEPDPGQAPALMPGLVTIGRSDSGADILIDLGFAAGRIAVTGDPTMAAEVVTALALELCINPWSQDATVVGAGLPPALHEIVGQRVRPLEELRSVRPGRPADLVLTGRHPGAVATFVLVADGRDADSLPRDVPYGLVRAGSAQDARWTIDVDSSGTAHIAPLGISVHATRATEGEIRALAGLLGAGSRTQDDGRPPVPDPPTPPVRTAALRAAPVRIQVLGQTLVEASGDLDHPRRTILTEAAICVALHPEGIRPSVLGAMLWPLGATSDVVDATVDRLRRWLGQDAEGRPHLREDADGRLRLGPGAVTDWDVMRSLLADSRTAPPRQEVELLIEALRLVRGPVGRGAPEGRYSWLARVRTARQVDALVVDAAHRVVELLGDTDPDGAALAVDAALQVVDLNQVLWRDRLRLAARRGRGELEREVLGLLELAGADELSLVDPATAALVEDLAPGLSVRRQPA